VAFVLAGFELISQVLLPACTPAGQLFLDAWVHQQEFRSVNVCVARVLMPCIAHKVKRRVGVIILVTCCLPRGG